MKLDIQARLVAAVCQFKADNDIRYYLNGVYVEPIPGGGVMIVATNGHAMGLWRDTTGEIDRPAILRIGKRLESACAGSDLKRLIISDDRLAVIIKQPSTTTEVHIQEKEDHVTVTGGWEVPGKFPDWRKVIPDESPSASLHDPLNAQYVALVHKALIIGSSDSSKFGDISLMQNERNKGIAAVSSCCPNFLAVIMPMLGNNWAKFPDWVRELKPKPAAEPLPEQQPSDAAPGAAVDDVAVEQQPTTEDSGLNDPLYEQAVALVLSQGRASVSMVQRMLNIGYQRSAELLRAMEGTVISPSCDGPRTVLPSFTDTPPHA